MNAETHTQIILSPRLQSVLEGLSEATAPDKKDTPLIKEVGGEGERDDKDFPASNKAGKPAR